MTAELPSRYQPRDVERRIYARWEAAGYFDAEPEPARAAYCVMIPPPNVTDRLHVGHALNNTLQDVLVRFHRMQGQNALWLPGTDHAGIATQTVVEKRILAEEGRRRTEFERDEFVARIQGWKDEYEATIIRQLKLMGCSCDWRRQRFTMDEVCARAVRETFFRLFRDGLIYRGKRLVNWDPATQTVLADDEVEHEEVRGHFWYLRYPLVRPVEVPSGGNGRDEDATSDEGGSAEDRDGRDAGILPASPEGVPPSDSTGVEKRMGRYLPHWTRAGATYALTFRLADSVPASVAEQWQRERRETIDRAERQGQGLTDCERREANREFSQRVDAYLDAGHGECLLEDPRVAETVLGALQHFEGERYELIAWCIMPNHVHVVVRPLTGSRLTDVVHSWKSFTANRINQLLDRTGSVWMEEYYDHLIRDERDYFNQINYILRNPVKARLGEWPWVGFRPVGRGQDGRDTRGQDGPDTRGQDARDTNCETRGQDARDTNCETRGQDGRDTRGQDARDTDADTTVIKYVTVATTRPETMLGDTAVAINPADPRAEALVGRKVRLPIVGRIIPIIADEHVVLPDRESDDEQARFSTGFLKVTPAHDPDDYEIGERHDLPRINILAPDGSISHDFGWEDWDKIKNPDVENLIGMDRFEAREAVVEWFRTEGLLEDVREYVHQVGHSYRSHVPIEPYLSDQWYIAGKEPIDRLADEYGDGLIEGTDIPQNSLAGLALGPLLDGRIRFIPDRYARTYQTWLENLRDWPISRQLWWGHRIPVWVIYIADQTGSEQVGVRQLFEQLEEQLHEFESSLLEAAARRGLEGSYVIREHGAVPTIAYVCPLDERAENAFPEILQGLTEQVEDSERDPDVLDTWFSSALWPFSTLGWPEETPELEAFYPTDVLCTAREIITLWVSRMVMMGQYCAGDIPFADVFIHAMIQDGEGRKMSKSLGNGIDPLDIIESHGADAMRFTLASMTTQTQDVRMPVEAVELPGGRTVNSSPKFDLGRNFANKLWNAARFALMNLADGAPPVDPEALAFEDRWILSRRDGAVRAVRGAIEQFRFNDGAQAIYDFTWHDFCDWYVEIIKPRFDDQATGPQARAVLAFVLDTILRLLHPFMPFITDELWSHLGAAVPVRGMGEGGRPAQSVMVARWPRPTDRFADPELEAEMETVQEIIRGVRNIRSKMRIDARKPVEAIVSSKDQRPRAVVEANRALVAHLANISELTVAESAEKPARSAAEVVGRIEVYVPLRGLIDLDAERERLEKQLDDVRS
ncbi:MAG: valine--tRNA ligase, partial [Planctomycetota bacterium]